MFRTARQWKSNLASSLTSPVWKTTTRPMICESPAGWNLKTNPSQLHIRMDTSEVNRRIAPARSKHENHHRRHPQRLQTRNHPTQVPQRNRRRPRKPRKVICRRKRWGVYPDIHRCLILTDILTRTRWSCCLSTSRCSRRRRLILTWTTRAWKRRPVPVIWWWESAATLTARGAV